MIYRLDKWMSGLEGACENANVIFSVAWIESQSGFVSRRSISSPQSETMYWFPCLSPACFCVQHLCFCQQARSKPRDQLSSPLPHCPRLHLITGTILSRCSQRQDYDTPLHCHRLKRIDWLCVCNANVNLASENRWAIYWFGYWLIHSANRCMFPDSCRITNSLHQTCESDRKLK